MWGVGRYTSVFGESMLMELINRLRSISISVWSTRRGIEIGKGLKARLIVVMNTQKTLLIPAPISMQRSLHNDEPKPKYSSPARPESQVLEMLLPEPKPHILRRSSPRRPLDILRRSIWPAEVNPDIGPSIPQFPHVVAFPYAFLHGTE